MRLFKLLSTIKIYRRLKTRSVEDKGMGSSWNDGGKSVIRLGAPFFVSLGSESSVKIIFIRFFIRTIFIRTFRQIFLSSYSNGKYLRDNFP